MSSPYPRDDFDAVTPPRDGRRGAHRAAPRRPGGFLAPAVVALVVAASAGVGYVAYSTIGSTASASSPSVSAPAAGADAADVAGQPAAGQAPSVAASRAASAAGSPSASSSSAAKKAPVVVLNGTATSGLAAKEAARVQSQGWQVSSTGNASAAQRSAHSTTTVLFPTAQLEGAAKALAAGIGATTALDPEVQAGSLTVVMR